MIRLGGNHLIIKVVTVSRNMDPEDTARKKVICIHGGVHLRGSPRKALFGIKTVNDETYMLAKTGWSSEARKKKSCNVNTI
ncbi:UNVERIFIED_CONTAM: hypothetical protein FKN15_069619 [Acipenser sinensis]